MKARIEAAILVAGVDVERNFITRLQLLEELADAGFALLTIVAFVLIARFALVRADAFSHSLNQIEGRFIKVSLRHSLGNQVAFVSFLRESIVMGDSLPQSHDRVRSFWK